MAPWLSILIPFHNVEEYLGPCLDSVLAQRLDQVEVVALDDRSTDGSLALLRGIAARSAQSIRIIEQARNGGVSAARNTLLDAARGRYVWFLDSDDLMAEGAVERLRAVVEAHAPDLVLCDFSKFRSGAGAATADHVHGPRIASFTGASHTLLRDPERLFAGLYAQGRLHCWSKIATRALWSSDLRFPEGRYFEDMAVTPLLALRARTYYHVPEAWVRYRKRAGSILSVPSLEKVDDMAAGVTGVLGPWLAAHPEMHPRTRFRFTAYCVRILGFVMKDLRTLGEDTPARIARYRGLFYESTGLTRASLVGQYLRHGNIARLLRHWRYL